MLAVRMRFGYIIIVIIINNVTIIFYFLSFIFYF